MSLDGILIEVTHDRPASEVVADLESFAQDVAQNRFPEWGVKLERDGERMRLLGARDASRFDATVSIEPKKVILELTGVADIGFLKYTAAGGSDGVRARVKSTLRNSLEQHLGG